MKIALPVKNGYVNERFEDTNFFAILHWDGEKVVTNKIIRATEFKEEYGRLINLLKGEGVNTVIANDIGVNGLNSLRRAGFEVISGASGEIEQIAYDYSKSRLMGTPV